jgi:nucleotide-binding universal stress UspA family protein
MTLLASKRFLVALDSSPRASLVLAHAVELASKLGARLVLLRVSGIPIGVPLEAFVSSPVELAEMLEKVAQDELQRQADGVPPALLEKMLTLMGTPWDGICSTAKQENVDLIIIGSHGYAGLDRILGTTASRVVNHADRSVLVVRGEPINPG